MNDKVSAKKSANGNDLVPEVAAEVVKPSDYLRTVKNHLRKGNNKAAFALLQEAALQYPEDPFILSYYGCLQALVDKKYRTGVEKCKAALALIKKQSSFGEEMLYPVFYLNLGRAYVAAGKKKEALEVFNNGLNYDNKNREILQEVRALGMRKKTPLSFLDRSNPIIKYVGLILHPAKKEPVKKK